MRKPSLSALKIPTLTASKYHSVLCISCLLTSSCFYKPYYVLLHKVCKNIIIFFRVDGTLLSDCTRTLRVVWYLSIFHLPPLKMRARNFGFLSSINQSIVLTNYITKVQAKKEQGLWSNAFIRPR